MWSVDGGTMMGYPIVFSVLRCSRPMRWRSAGSRWNAWPTSGVVPYSARAISCTVQYAIARSPTVSAKKACGWHLREEVPAADHLFDTTANLGVPDDRDVEGRPDLPRAVLGEEVRESVILPPVAASAKASPSRRSACSSRHRAHSALRSASVGAECEAVRVLAVMSHVLSPVNY
jgi:hypothetical protein